MRTPLSTMPVLLLALLHAAISPALAGEFRVGAGIHDITGTPAKQGMIGYGDFQQRTAGIHTRLRSRAFVIEDSSRTNRVAIVTADLWGIPQLVKLHVVDRLKKKYGNRYSDDNVLLMATHTHSGPGGFSEFAVFNFVSWGFNERLFHTVVDGITRSIEMADSNLEDASILFNTGKLWNTSQNRSREAYLRNPGADPVEDTNKNMVLLRFEAANGRGIGLLNWFAVHTTSMSKRNLFISGDNKGHAAFLFERRMGTDYFSPKTFVAAFANSDSGDVSPALRDDTRLDDFQKTAIIGERQYGRAKALYENAEEKLNGKIEVRHLWLPMPGTAVSPEFTGTKTERLCQGALGEAFAAGAEDGPSEVPGFREGATQQDPARLPWYISTAKFLLNTLLVGNGSEKDKACQFPKAILAATGKKKHSWTPNVIPFQIVRIGSLALLGVSAETTTMAGRELRELVLQRLAPAGVKQVVIGGLANTYSLYVTTPAEYQTQQYEGGATLFGPHTFAAYKQTFALLADSIREGTTLRELPRPRTRRLKDLPNYQQAVMADGTPLGESFGDVLVAPKPSYRDGESVQAVFRAGDPRNDFRIQSSYVEVQRLTDPSTDDWTTVAWDGDPATVYEWKRDIRINPFLLRFCLGCSKTTVYWHIPADAKPGLYRIVHHGNWKSKWSGKVRPYTGVTGPFEVIPQDKQGRGNLL